MRKWIMAAVVLSCACSKPVTAMSTCERIAATGVVSNCHPGTAGGLAGAALERVEFDLPSVPGEHGSVFLFQSDADYTATVASYQSAAILAGPHRYGNEKRRIFLQMNRKASPEVGAKTRSVIEGL